MIPLLVWMPEQLRLLCELFIIQYILEGLLSVTFISLALTSLKPLMRGGQVIYFGPLGRNSHKIFEYFEAIPRVPNIKDKYNLATWMLEVSSVDFKHHLGIDIAEHYKNSSLHKRNRDLVKEIKTSSPGAKDLYFAT